jgi:hypothetical protein
MLLAVTYHGVGISGCVVKKLAAFGNGHRGFGLIVAKGNLN